jgi:outer membrane protein OmpA-like peptidoglycan-associated protein
MSGKFPVVKVLGIAALVSLITSAVWCQISPAHPGQVPIYQVTVIERTVKAVDYQYRNGPTKVDFRGTILLPHAKGEATVESKAGRVDVEAKFERTEAPGRFGGEYLTYVLWAITPEGHPRNLGEVLADGSDHARLHVTTDLQSFGMIVTAEPYSAVRLPSDVVVMENQIRPDTAGKTELIDVKYELMPRGHYTYTKPLNLEPTRDLPKVSMAEYETQLEVYQALNAVQIAKSQGADRYASDTYGKAEALLRSAQELRDRRADRSMVVTTARQAAQTAEDARAIAEKRKHSEELAQARDSADRERQGRMQAEEQAQRAQIQASADRSTLEAERLVRRQAEEAAAAATATAAAMPPPPQRIVVVPAQPAGGSDADRQIKTGRRMRLMQQLSSALPARDTPRGLVITVPDADFRGSALHPAIAARLAGVASILAAQPGLFVDVEGHSDEPGARAEEVSYLRASAVRDVLARNGISRSSISARSLGNSRPLGSNASAGWRERNRRVEITVSGEPIGGTAYWDKTYSLTSQR